MTTFYIAIGGILGTLARFGLAGWIHSWAGAGFPWGILAVNASGSAVLGLLMPALLEGGATPALRAGVAIGFFGAFTTMSTFGYETVALLEAGQWVRAGAYVAATIFLVLGGMIAGLSVGTLWIRGGG